LHKKIVWEDHTHVNNNNDNGHISWVLSVDGTHCRIQEPRTVPDKNWYSHKHHKPCVAYEIAVSLKESKIAWVSGPHQAGETDLVIFRKRDGLLSRIPDGFKMKKSVLIIVKILHLLNGLKKLHERVMKM
jgi:DDE superfamily endonuclease